VRGGGGNLFTLFALSLSVSFVLCCKTLWFVRSSVERDRLRTRVGVCEISFFVVSG